MASIEVGALICRYNSLGGQGGSRFQGILSHFEQEIRSIAQSVLKNSSDDNCVLWKPRKLFYVRNSGVALWLRRGACTKGNY
jgi:hypothetical protein